MLSLTLGLCAALAWGIHDICVRYVSQRGGILPALATVLAVGCAIQLPLAISLGDWPVMTTSAYGLSLLSGVCYVFGCIGLYKAFAIGPVRLVAPIIGAYPILSIGWAAMTGQPVTSAQWLAVGLVISGVAVISVLSDRDESGGQQAIAIGWALLGAFGFAATFAIGQWATRHGDELPVILTARLVTTFGVLAIMLGSTGLRLPERKAWPLLGLMGLLDAMALAIVIAAGGLDRPEFAAVSASIFGMVTIILAWAFLKERMTIGQWLGVATTFAGIGYLAL